MNRKIGISLLLIFMVLLHGCDENNTSVVKSKPESGMEKWIGAWEADLSSAFGDDYVNEMGSKIASLEAGGRLEVFRVGNTVIFANNSTFFWNFTFDMVLSWFMDDGRRLKIRVVPRLEIEGTYIIAGNEYSLVFRNTKGKLKEVELLEPVQEKLEAGELWEVSKTFSEDIGVGLYSNNMGTGNWAYKMGKLVLKKSDGDTLVLNKKKTN